MSKLSMHVGVKSDVGNVKEVNQDNFLVKLGSKNGSDFGLFVICDGLGGLSGGEIASKIVVKQFANWWHAELVQLLNLDIINDAIIIESLKNVINHSNRNIYELSIKNNQRMGTTASVLFIYEDNYYVAHVGDSRIYGISSEVSQLTEDHTYYAMLKRNGRGTCELTNIKKNVLVQCVGAKDDIYIYTATDKIKNDTFFILCSDGFCNKTSHEEMLILVDDLRDPCDSSEVQTSCNEAIESVKSKGERDNITLILAKVECEKDTIIGKISTLWKVN